MAAIRYATTVVLPAGTVVKAAFSLAIMSFVRRTPQSRRWAFFFFGGELAAGVPVPPVARLGRRRPPMASTGAELAARLGPPRRRAGSDSTESWGESRRRVCGQTLSGGKLRVSSMLM